MQLRHEIGGFQVYFAQSCWTLAICETYVMRRISDLEFRTIFRFQYNNGLEFWLISQWTCKDVIPFSIREIMFCLGIRSTKDWVLVVTCKHNRGHSHFDSKFEQNGLAVAADTTYSHYARQQVMMTPHPPVPYSTWTKLFQCMTLKRGTQSCVISRKRARLAHFIQHSGDKQQLMLGVMSTEPSPSHIHLRLIWHMYIVAECNCH